MDALRLSELQDSLVAAVANGITQPWEAAVVNVEIDAFDGDQTENCLALSFRQEASGTWLRDSFELPFDCYDLFIELRSACRETEEWKSCTLEFRTDGRYKFAYSYDPPRRLNGDHGAEAMLKNYVPPQLGR